MQVTIDGWAPSSPSHEQRSKRGGSTSRTSHLTIPSQNGRIGRATKRKCVPAAGWNPSGRPPRPAVVHSGTSSGSVSARQTFRELLLDFFRGMREFNDRKACELEASLFENRRR
jgi:hypothetical protein